MEINRQAQELTPEKFTLLLQWLAADPQVAGERYNKLLQRLNSYFTCRQCWEVERLADITLDRVAHALAQNKQITGEPEIYCLGVARYVALEYFRSRERGNTPLEEFTPSLGLTVPSHVEQEERILEEELSDHERETYLRCLRHCLKSLAMAQQQLLTDYYQGEEPGENKKTRKMMAEKLGVSGKALTLRIQRLRDKLAGCIRECVQS